MSAIKNVRSLLMGVCLVMVLPNSGLTQTVQILAPSPPGNHTCVAVPFDVPTDMALAGLRWLNNDSQSPFPRLLLMEGTPGQAPDLSKTGMILFEAQAGDLAWGELSLATPVSSSTGFIYAVFVYPPNTDTTGVGAGGGPGLGILRESSANPFFISADGVEWVAFGRDARLAVEPVVVGGLAKGAADRKLLSELSEAIQYDPAAPDDPAPELPVEVTVLYPAAPNPFNPRTKIRYDLSEAGPVSLRIYDVRGRAVADLVSGKRPSGRYSVTWEGRDHRGASVASGVYIVKLEAGPLKFTKRMVLVR